MVVHMSVLKTLPGHEDDLIGALAEFAAYLREELPELVEFTWGPNFHPKSREAGYTHGTVMIFTDRDAYDRFLQLPRHKALHEQFHSWTESRFAVDYLVPSGATVREGGASVGGVS